MNLNDIFKNYPYFRQSTPDDNQNILNFFKSITMDTKSFSLRYDRGNDFFEFAREQGEQNFTFVIEDEKKLIKGTASITLINHLLNGEKVLLAYLGDLRISPTLNAKIRIQWKKCYSEIIEHFHNLDEFKNVKHLYSAILEENENAMRSLVKNNDKLIYHELTRYETFNIYLQKPFIQINKFFTIENVRAEIFKKHLANFSKRNGLQDYFSENSKDEFNRRLETWKNFDEKNLFILKNDKGQVIATVAPWLCTSKKLVVEKMSNLYKKLGIVLPYLGMPKFQEHAPINVLYLTHLKLAQNLSKDEINDAINYIVYYFINQKNRNFHTISFFSFPEYNLTDLPFFFEKTPARFYQVMNKENYESKNFLNLNHTPPAFEIGTA